MGQSHLEDAVPFSKPAIAELAPLSALRAEYENGSGSFIRQIDFLKAQGYKGIRRSRGDGDCFYRCPSLLPIPRIPSPSLARPRALIVI
jgi:ubiquitin thioesterase protein OTUB1